MRGMESVRLRVNDHHEARSVSRRTKAMTTLAVAAAIVSWLAVPAYPQSIQNRKSGGPSNPPPVEQHPPVDEKAYKAALDRIPVPDKPYDPWGIARPAEPGKNTKKSNQGISGDR